jgi:hypothetical protein
MMIIRASVLDRALYGQSGIGQRLDLGVGVLSQLGHEIVRLGQRWNYAAGRADLGLDRDALLL